MQNDNFELLGEGISLLCKNDPVINMLIAPRCDVIISSLVRYICEIEKVNRILKLVGTNDRRELILKHILDSLAPLGIILRKHEACGRQMQIADVGSGAGLPGVPLAIALPDAQVTLIERMGRRAGFLRSVQTALGLSNVVVEESEMEKAARGRFTLVTCRAFKPLEPKMFKKLFRLCGESGFLMAYKGRRSKTEAEIAALEQALPDLAGRWEIIPCPVPLLDEERHLLVIR
jgi:16S rRNA (guanine527-N7)-methyltransferase